MAVSVVMPALEMAQETGKLVSWRKKEGDRVAKGETLMEVETDKAVVEVEAQAEGVLGGVTAKTGDVVPVGQTIAWLLQPGEKPPAATAQAQTGRKMESSPAAQAATPAPAAPAAAAAGPLQVSPKARRLAKEHGVDVSQLWGSGPGGEIVAEDVLAAAKAQTAAPAVSSAPPAVATPTAPPARLAPSAGAGVSDTLSSIGRLMAERTTQSWTTVPHFFVTREVDGSALVAVREKLAAAIERSHGVKLTYTDLLAALVARVLKQHPRMNASWVGDRIKTNPEVKVGLAVAVEDGVVVGVINKADTGELADIAVQRRDLTERARAGKLTPADITGATFTISNLGMYHVDQFTAIIVPPQAGILAVGAMTDRVVPMPGALIPVGIRPMLTLTLSCDHRVLDGARGAAFLHDVVEAIRQADKHLG
jgi:pyruvate dehydrogenase E2 component (dihydrolipoyllysine-residue acetyltransferase)